MTTPNFFCIESLCQHIVSAQVEDFGPERLVGNTVRHD
jgi:hypothetical protein